eukprot:COSAG01_NODE_173_length_23099_cov_37.564783_10_plen_155_part_00
MDRRSKQPTQIDRKLQRLGGPQPGHSRRGKAYRTVRPDQLARCGSRDQTQLGSLVGHVHLSGRVSLGAVRGPWGDPKLEAVRVVQSVQATPARTRMAFATCPGLTLDGPRLPILGCTLPNCGAARGEDSLLQSPAECGRMHAPVDSETDLTLAV